MKKLILFISFVFAFAIQGNSQALSYVNMLSPHGNASDTTVNTSTDSLKIVLTQSYSNITIQPKVTKISGTMNSNSTPTLYGSLDGKNYYAIPGDTLHITNTSSPIVDDWVLTSQAYRVYKIVWTGTGTMSAKLEAKIMLIK